MNRKRFALFAILSVIWIGISIMSIPLQMETLYETNFGVEVHVEMWLYDSEGNLKEYSHHPGVLTTLGQNWIEDQLGDSPGTEPAKWIAVSNDAGAPSSAWVVIPNEITTNGMGRAEGTYADDGDGAWNITKSFSPTGSGSCQLTGLYWASTGDYLLCADTFTQINYEDGDTVQIRWSLSVTGA